MSAEELSLVCRRALAEGRYVWLSHRGVFRDVYPFSIREGKLYCWCSLHSDREVEGMYLGNIDGADVSRREVGMLFGYPSEFAPEEED